MATKITFTFINVIKDDSCIQIEAFNYDDAVKRLEEIAINAKEFQIDYPQ